MKVALKQLFFVSVFFTYANSIFAQTAKTTDCISSVLERLHIEKDMVSDPLMMRNVVFNEFYLDGFPESKNLIQKYLDEPQPLSDFLAKIRTAIETKHPAIHEALCVAVEKNIIPQMEEHETTLIKRTIHTMLVLEALLQEMARDVDFMVKIKEHYLNKRYKLLPKNSSLLTIYHATGGLFQEAKFLTMDKVFDQYFMFRMKDHLDAHDLAAKNRGLRLNIIEATLADEVHLNMNNAYAGRTLIANPIEALEHAEDGLIKQYFTHGWSALYETWNLAFVLGNLDNLHLILPKLLIPSVIGASEEDYLYYRGLSLWLIINVSLLHNLHHKGSVALPASIKKPLVHEWGIINKKYAQKIGNLPKRFVLPELMSVGLEALRDSLTSDIK